MKKIVFLFSVICISFLSINRLSAQVNNVYISEIMYDSPLKEDKVQFPTDHNNGEYIKLFNPTSNSIDVSSWVIQGDEQSEQFSFPVGTIIPAQGILLIAYKSGTSFDFASYYQLGVNVKIINQSSIILCNLGENLILFDASSNIVDEVAYGDRATSPYNSGVSTDNHNDFTYNQLFSLHRTQVCYGNGQLTPFAFSDMAYGLATPSLGGNALVNVNNTIPTIDPSTALSEISGQNYIITSVPLVAKTSVSVGAKDELTTIQYFDGLGRPIETVQKGQSSTDGKTWVDLVNYTEYDGVGRENKHWLPVPSTNDNGAFVTLTDFNNLANTQYGSSEKPFSLTEFEASPLSRITGQFGAGAAWQNATPPKKVKTEYLTNDGTIAFFYVNSSGNLQRDGNYAANTLYKTHVTDEDGKTTTEYKDKLGQVVMNRSYTNVDTYYVYNDLGQLSYVIPPIAADNLGSGTYANGDDNSILKAYCYLYKYDERGNCIVKTLPGCNPIYMVYDRADRLILSQDGNQRLKTPNPQWTVTKYDALGRVVYTGIINKDITSTEKANVHDNVMVESYEGTSGFKSTGYSWSGFNLAASDFIPLAVNYYDNYSFIPSGDKLLYDNAQDQNGYTAQWANAKGLLTGTRTYILDGAGTNYTTSAVYYDFKGQVVQSRSTNHLGGYDIVYNHYDFTGKVLNLLKEHSIAGQTVPLLDLYTYGYDQAGRLTTTTYQLNNATAIVLSTQSYDELGRLIKKMRHGIADTETYAYNIRNWATKITSGSFYEELFYNTNLPTGSTACYNGNIAYMKWKASPYNYGYSYTYDDLNRLKFATAFKGFSTTLSACGYSEDFGYDKQGNIKTLQRKSGMTLIDNLGNYNGNSIPYNGNQMMAVTDYAGSQNLNSTKEYNNRNLITNDFAYDANGNMTMDLDRNIVTIRYNVLNLPDIIQFKDGHQIINAYDAGGQKLSSRYYTVMVPTEVPMISTLQPGQVLNLQYNMDIIDETGTFYVDNFEYEFNGCDPGVYNLKRVDNSEGYYSYDGTVLSSGFMYNRKDHLGNIREVWNASNNTTAQRTQYYPSGLPWASNSIDHPEAQNKKYNGKEFVEMHGYDTYDIVWRQYYPAIARFQTPDPEIEDAYNESPYAMCDNNMVNRTDPDGRFWNYVIGAAVGAGIDYASQVAVNFVEGKGVKESFTQVDGKSIMVSAVAGATGVGLASLAQKATTIYKLGSASTKVVGTVAGVVSDGAISAGSQYAKNGSVSAKNVAVDVVAGQAGRKVGNLVKAKVQSSETGVSYQKQSNRAAGKAMHNPNAAKTTRAAAAAAKSNNYGSKTETAVSSATSNTTSAGYETVKKIKEEKR